MSRTEARSLTFEFQNRLLKSTCKDRLRARGFLADKNWSLLRDKGICELLQEAEQSIK